MALLCIVAPGIIAAAYSCRLKKQTLISVNFITDIILYIFLTNLFVMGIACLRGYALSSFETLFINIGNTFKYGTLALVAAVALPNILLLLSHIKWGQRHE